MSNGFVALPNRKPPVPIPNGIKNFEINCAVSSQNGGINAQSPTSPAASSSSDSSSGLKGLSGTVIPIGLQSAISSKFLTIEKFGGRLNASSGTLRQRQTLQIVLVGAVGSDGPNGQKWEAVHLKGPNNRFLRLDKKLGVLCEDEAPKSDNLFEIILGSNDVQSENSSTGKFPGSWLLKHIASESFLALDSSTEDALSAVWRNPTPACYWYCNLATHPIVNLKNLGRDRYTHVNASRDGFYCQEVIPWGGDSLIFLQPVSLGRYAIRATCLPDQPAVYKSGELAFTTSVKDKRKNDVQIPNTNSYINPGCLFTIDVHNLPSGQGGITFRDSDGFCLAQSGIGLLRSSVKKTIGKDEIFQLTESKPQVSFVNVGNRKRVSIRQGTDVSANQLINAESDQYVEGARIVKRWELFGEDAGKQPSPVDDDDDDGRSSGVTDNEVFQIEVDSRSGGWRLRTCKGNLWSLQRDMGVTAANANKTIETLFTASWNAENATVSFRGVNNHLVKAKNTGALTAASTEMTEREQFRVQLINRPRVCFKGQFGFLNFREQSNNWRVEGNRSAPEMFKLYQDLITGFYALKGSNDLFMRSDSGSGQVFVDSKTPQWFTLELRGGKSCVIGLACSSTPSYLRCEQTGCVSFSGKDPDQDQHCKWTF